MAKNYILFNNADESITDTTYPSWEDTWVGLMNQGNSISISEMTGFYAGNNFSTPNQYGNTVTPFQFPLTATSGSSDWIMLSYDYVDASTTGVSHITSNVNALDTYVNTTQGSSHLDAEYSSITSQSLSVFFSSTLGISNVSNAHFSLSSYNWAAVDTSGYTYSDGFASSISGNEDYPTDYWSKTSFQTDTINYKDQVIEKISTNQDDIIEFLVKNSLTPEALKRLHVQLSNDGIIT